MDINTIINYTIFNNTISQYLIFLLYVAGGLLIAKITYMLLEKVLKPLSQKTSLKFDDYIFEIIDKPLVFFITIMGFLLATKQLTLGAKGLSITDGLIFIFITLNIAYLLVKFIDVILTKYVMQITNKTSSDLDDQIIPLINKISFIAIYGFAFVFILKHFGYEVSSLVAGLGIGGLAFALAAKDILSNLFGSISIMADKPFKTGDWIKIGNYDGFVKDIGLRTTKIKTLEGSYVTIPNNSLTTDPVENLSRRRGRKTKLNIGLVYETSSKKMQEGVDIIKKILRNCQDVKENDFYVHFSNFGDFSLNIAVIYWIHSSKYNEIINTRHNINMEIKKQFESAGLEMAFPTQTVYVKR